MNKLKLDFTGLSLKELRSHKESIIMTIGQLKSGFYTAEAALGLKSSIDLLMDVYDQISIYYQTTIDSLPEIEINNEK